MSEATAERPAPPEATALVQSEREALEAWMRWGTRLDPQLLDRAMAKVPVQLSLDRQ
jgi:hypothetical protein